MRPTLSAEERRVWRVIGIALAQLPEGEHLGLKRPLVELGLALRDGERVDELFVADLLGVLALTDRRLIVARRKLRDLFRRRVVMESISYDRIAFVEPDVPGAPRATVAVGVTDGPTAVIGLENKRATDRLVAALASRITAKPEAFGQARVWRKERVDRIVRTATIPLSTVLCAAMAAGLAGFGVLSLNQAIACAILAWLFQLFLLVAETRRDAGHVPEVPASAPPPDARLWL